MNLKLSVVDQSPIHMNGPATDAPHFSTRLATACEKWGYYRYWIAEHHNTPSYASPCPEILIAHIVNATKTIRVGSGGVMLSHYSPYKVAEVFRMLAVLYPDRIDLGIGRAPGGDPLASEALSFPANRLDPALYEEQARQLVGFLRNNLRADHPFSELSVMPPGNASPEMWMLGSGGGSAEFAGQLGMNFALALFIGTHDRPTGILDHYRQAYRNAGHEGDPNVMLAAAVICADSEDEAEFLAASHTYWKVQAFRHGIREGIKSPEDALNAKAKLSVSDQAYFDETLSSIICGTPEDCRQELEQLAKHYKVDEITIVNVTHDFEPRLRSYELLASGFDFRQQSTINTETVAV
jgi:luciferase family oxidoreductase group 1